MDLPRSPLAPKDAPLLHSVAGARIAAVASGYRYKGRPDLVLLELAPGSALAGVFTKSLTAGAPVLWCRDALKAGGGKARAVLVNAGNSNAFTGKRGAAATATLGKAVADLLNCAAEEVFIASTGVIGVPLEAARLEPFLAVAHDGLSGSPESWAEAARGIMTTDTFSKAASRRCSIGGTAVTLTGIAKGSGMIAPDMATMIALATTDAAIAPAVLQQLLAEAAERSFNCITVDSDTSTSDSLFLAATGAAGNAAVSDADDPALAEFRAALLDLMQDLALQVVKDGEGAQKLIAIAVTGAADDGAAKRIGLAIANSPLVKTAIAGSDANWGRIVMAVGKAGEAADRDRLAITIGGFPVASEGGPVEGYDEAPVAAHMKGDDIRIAVDVGVGDGAAEVWTCDLTHGYIDINADYRS